MLERMFHMPALSKVSMMADHDRGYTWIVCRLTASSRLYVFLCSGDHFPGPILDAVARVHALLGVLEDDLDEGAELGGDDVGDDPERAVHGGRHVAHLVVGEHPVGDVEVLGELQRRVGVLVGDAVEAVAELALDVAPGDHELDGSGDVDPAVVVGPLRVGPRGAGREVPPERPPLVERPGPAGGRLRHVGRRRGAGAGVADDGGGGPGVVDEPGGGHQVVVTGRLVGVDQHGEAVADVDVEGVVRVLHGVGAVHLHQPQVVALDAEVERRLDARVADAEPVRLAGLEGEHGRLGRRRRGVLGPSLAVDEHAGGAADGAAGVEQAGHDLVVLGVPVADEHRVVAFGRRLVEGHRDEQPADDADGAVAARGALHAHGREVEEGADLVLGLPLVGEVGVGRDGALRPGHAVHPRVLAVLHPVPGEEQRLVQLVEDVDDDVVVGGAVDPRPGELAVDEDHLLGHAAQQGLGAVRHLPLEEQVRVLGPRQRRQHQQQQHAGGGDAHGRRHVVSSAAAVSPPDPTYLLVLS
ncbi:hypothetical protein U9M48_044347 [Paspalum notatum var. saurae]|uniref:Uncharacterized protein n=1 Tax=Paspalum notatum var. saurae TaxID=547442 RepID=A0AAQ3XI58_PASNO